MVPFLDVIATPEELDKLAPAFDEAWLIINRAEAQEALYHSAARERLGYIIVGLWRANPNQPLAESAAKAFLNGLVFDQRD